MAGNTSPQKNCEVWKLSETAALTSCQEKESIREAAAWVELVTGEPLPYTDDLTRSLRSGEILCKLLNVCVPGTVSKNTFHEVAQYLNQKSSGRLNSSMIDFKQRENISTFLKVTHVFSIWQLSI